ncbi:putative glutathione S-transferase 8 [Orchesella cincta]|uniref:glutathione transferase n=1 Tax=Orchesella cincta TaxID=48709 RepID=A0A1D2ML16_ORCCI|nr:putative glutathione S-transferase 8 [Orchesella cincta]
MDMDTYKLTYFDLRGIAEPIRLIFRYANIPFEDCKVNFELWKDVKHNFKWQQLPILEHNGKTLTQSVGISRFLASKFELKPQISGNSEETAWVDAKCDEIVGAIHDLRLQMKPFIHSKMGVENPEDGDMLKNTLLTSTVPRFLENLTEILIQLRQNGSVDESGNFIFGKKPTWPDFWLAHFTHQWSEVLEEPQLLDKYDLLKKQQEEVYNLPGVAEWIKERPDSFI